MNKLFEPYGKFTSMRRKTRFVLLLPAAAILVPIALFTWGRLRGPDTAQAAALSLLQPSPAPATSRNAWPSWWLIDHDVPPGEIHAVYVRDRQRMTGWIHQRMTGSSRPFVSRAHGHYRKLPSLDSEQRAVLCRFRKNRDCLSHVRRHSAAVAAVVAEQHVRLQRFRAMRHDKVLWNSMQAYGNAPIPDVSPLENLWLSSAALTYVRGHHARAMTSMCSNALMLRRLHAHTNALLPFLITAIWMQDNERLLADMLSRLPRGQLLPTSCRKAFAPVTPADTDLCPAMQTQYVGTRRMFWRIAATARQPRWLIWLYFDPRHAADRLLAPNYAWPCTAKVEHAMLTDQRVNVYDAPQPNPDFLDWLSNADSVRWARQVTWPSPYAGYLHRTEDYAASLRLMAWLIRMHASPTNPTNWRRALQQARPQLMQSGRRNFSLTDDGRHVRMAYYHEPSGRDALVLHLPQASVHSGRAAPVTP